MTTNDPSKNSGAVYTPIYIVNNILNLVGYNDFILNKHIIDNSCGEGAFLIEVVDRYCKKFISCNKDLQELKIQLETYIHGIDNNAESITICKYNLDNLCKQYGLKNINWDISPGNTLDINKYNSMMDFVVGNPPYVRVHNLETLYDKVKSFSFAKNGMTDLYIVFFEIGLNMLNKTGKMGLITPSSFLKSKAGTNLRNAIYKSRNLIKVVDLGHFQPFNALTYTMITIFDNSTRSDKIEYFIFDENTLSPVKIEDLSYENIFINNNFYFSTSDDLKFLRDIEKYYLNANRNNILVKNGFATLADDIFISDFNFDDLTIDVLKASTGKWYKCIFPYHNDGTPYSLHELQEHKYPYEYLLARKDKLLKRALDSKTDWYLFGRTQAIKDVFIDKVGINTIIKNLSSLKIERVPAGKGIFSGLYIISKYSETELRNSIESDLFMKYLMVLKNYKSSGYYSINSIELRKYLLYVLERGTVEQSRLFEYS